MYNLKNDVCSGGCNETREKERLGRGDYEIRDEDKRRIARRRSLNHGLSSITQIKKKISVIL
jgi:hypothetical protein